MPGTKIVTAPTAQQTVITGLLPKAAETPTVQKQKEIQANVDARRAVWSVLETRNITVKNTQRLLTPEETSKVEKATVAYIKAIVSEMVFIPIVLQLFFGVMMIDASKRPFDIHYVDMQFRRVGLIVRFFCLSLG